MHPNLRDVGLTVATESSVRFAGFVVVPLFGSRVRFEISLLKLLDAELASTRGRDASLRSNGLSNSNAGLLSERPSAERLHRFIQSWKRDRIRMENEVGFFSCQGTAQDAGLKLCGVLQEFVPHSGEGEFKSQIEFLKG